MDDLAGVRQPAPLPAILEATARLGFVFGSDPRTGNLLRALAASKPGGRMLELGTGTGLGAAWLLDGMDPDAQLVSVDCGEAQQAIARRLLGDDPRVTFLLQDAAEFLPTQPPASYDVIFSDAGPGKFTQLDAALALLRPGGFFVADDMFSFPPDRSEPVAWLRSTLVSRPDLVAVPMGWASSLVLCVRRP